MTNKYASNCTTCQVRVIAGAGVLSKVATGWNVSCGQHTATAKVVVLDVEAVARVERELTDARTAYNVAFPAFHASFQVVMATNSSRDFAKKEEADATHNLNTNAVMRARKRIARALSTLENLRAGR